MPSYVLGERHWPASRELLATVAAPFSTPVVTLASPSPTGRPTPPVTPVTVSPSPRPAAPHHAAHRVGQARQRVAEGGRDDLGASRDSGVLVAVHGVEGKLLFFRWLAISLRLLW